MSLKMQKKKVGVYISYVLFNFHKDMVVNSPRTLIEKPQVRPLFPALSVIVYLSRCVPAASGVFGMYPLASVITIPPSTLSDPIGGSQFTKAVLFTLSVLTTIFSGQVFISNSGGVASRHKRRRFASKEKISKIQYDKKILRKRV